VEQAFAVDIRQLRAKGFVQISARAAGALALDSSSDPVIGFTLDLTDQTSLHAEFGFTCGGVLYHQLVSIEALPCRYGGQRFYFVCPWTGRRCEKLYCVSGTFASRRFHRLTYGSQSDDRLSRLYRGAAKTEAQLISCRGRSRLHSAKRERIYARLERYQDTADALFAQYVIRRFGPLD